MHGSAHAAAGFAAYDQMRAARAAEQAYRHHSSAAAAAHSSSLHAEAAAAVAASADPLANLHTTAALHAAIGMACGVGCCYPRLCGRSAC